MTSSIKHETEPSDLPSAHKSIPSPTTSATSPYSHPSQTDANVDASDHCILTQTAEQVRPDTGDPCGDGRDAK